MSESKEQEKLTPASRKSYDKYMAEESIEPERAKSAEGDSPEGEEQKDDDREQKKQRRESGESQPKLAKLIRELITTRLQENDTKAVAGAVVKLISSENKEKSPLTDPKEEIAKIVLIVKQPDELAPGSSREAGADSVEQPPIVEAIYEAAETQGMDREAIEEIVEEEEDKQLPLQEKARFNRLQTFVEEKLEPASEGALKELKKDLQSVNSEDKEVKKTVDRAGTLLEDIIDEVEQQDDKATSEEDLQREFADVVASYINSSVQNAVEIEKGGETDAISEQEQKQAELMINMLLKPGDSAEDKSELLAALLHEYYPIEGRNAQKNEQARQFILQQAKLAGLDPTEIEEVEKTVSSLPQEKQKKIAGLEKLPDLNTFEQRVEKQIMNASPEEVKEIQDEWREILENAGDDEEIVKIAQEAIEVLGHIIKFKRAKGRGGRLDPRMFAKPKYLQDEESVSGQEDDETEKNDEEDERDSAKAELVKSVLTLFSTVNPRASEEDAANIQMLTNWIVSSQKPENKEQAVSTLLRYYAKRGTASDIAIQQDIRMAAAQQGVLYVAEDVLPTDVNTEARLRDIVAESVKDGAVENLGMMKNVWEQMLQNPELSKSLRAQLTDAVSHIETIHHPKKELSREQTIEMEVKETDKFAKAISEVFSPETVGSLNADAIDMLVVIAATPHKRKGAANENKAAEKEIAQLLLAFPVDEKSGREALISSDIRQEIINYAEKIGLDTQAIFLEHARLNENPTSKANNTLEEVIKRNIGYANVWEIHNIQRLWEKVVNGTDGSSDKAKLEKAVKPLRNIATAKEAQTKSQPADPSVLLENTIDSFDVPMSDAQKQARRSKQEREKDEVVAQSKEINTVQSFEEVTVANLQSYAEKLKDVLSTRGALSEEQLMEAYVALMTQITVLRNETERQGEALSFAAIQRETLPVMSQLLAQLREANRDKFAVNRRQMDAVLKERELLYREQSGFTEEMKIKNLDQNSTFTPIDVKGDRGEYLGRITDANRRIAKTVTDPAQLEKLIPEGMDPEKAEEYRNELRSIADPEILNNATNLAEMQKHLLEMEAAQTRLHRNEDGSPSYRSMTDMRSLVMAINEQRESLQALMGYRGIDEEGSDLDQSLYGGDIHEALGERMRRIKVQLGEEPSKDHEDYSDEELIAYYDELKVWANTILDNDKRRNPGKEANKGILDLDNNRYQKFLEFTNSKITDVNAQRGEMLDYVNYMLRHDPQGGDLLRYFMKNTPNPEIGIPDENNLRTYNPENNFNPEKLIGVPYQRPQELGGMGDTPRTLKDTMHTIAEEFSNDKNNFHAGGNRELIDAQGNFHYENFIYWIRLKINEDVDYNNDAPIQPFGKIIIKLPMSQISMFELLLLIPEFSSQRRLEIKQEEGGGVRAGWGTKAEHPKLSWANLDFIGQEMEFRQMTHEARIKFVNNEISGSKQKFLDLMNELHGSNNWVRSSNIFRLLGYPSSVTNGSQEVDDWLDNDKEKQGSIGKSMCDMIVAYYYLSELTDYHQKKYRDHDGKGIKREKNFNENMFYRFWEPDGANKFLIKMAEGALNANNEAKSKYVDFVKKRISAAEQTFLHKPELNEEQKIKIQQMAEVQRGKLLKLQEGSNNINIDINFTESEHLLNLHKLVERDVLKSGKSEERLALDVRDEMVNNLKEEYFKPLVDMTVTRIDLVDSNGNRVDEELYPIKDNGERIPNMKPLEEKPKDRDSTVSFLRPFGKIRFGDIAVDRNSKGKTTLTMEQLLLGDGKDHKGFDVNQIYRFDYSNNKNSILYKNNPFRSELDKEGVDKDNSATLRRMIDAYMDPNNKLGKENHDLFRQNEKMMLAFTKHVAQIKREEINHFRDQHENTLARDMIARAFRSCIERVHGIDSTESEYAWWWTRDYVYLWGIGATLDVTGIGFRQDGKLFNTGIWRPRRMAKDGGGNPDTYDEFLAMSLPFLHHVRVHNTHRDDPLGHRSIFYYLQGGEGSHITPRAVREFDPRSYYRFEQGAEQQYVKNTLNSGSELLELLSQTEFDMTKILEFDIHGNVVFDYGKAREIFGKWRGSIRYAYGKNKLDYREKIWSNGREKTLYEHFFGPKTRALNDLITQKVPKHTVDRMYKEPFDAVMMSIIAAEVHEHRKMFSSGHHWSIQNVIELERFLLEFMEEKGQEEDYDGVKRTVSKGSLLTREIFAAGLNAYHTGYAKMYAVEFNSGFWAAVAGGLWEGLKASFKGIKPY